MSIEDKILDKFPEFSDIKNDELQQKAIATVIEALELGGWSVEDVDTIPFTLLIPDCPVSYREHVRSVTQVAVEAAKVMISAHAKYYSLNMDILITGALLHDVGKLLEYKREDKKFFKSASGKLLRHPFSGAGLATKHGLPNEVVHMIATHAKEGEGGYRTPESIIVHHADFINFEPLRNEL